MGLKPRSQPVEQVATAVTFAHAFVAGTTLERGEKKIHVDVVYAGELTLTSGKIWAGDPFVHIDARPLARSVSPGRYPVWLSKVTTQYPWGEPTQRIACAKVLFSEAAAVRWENAAPHGQDPLPPGKQHKYFVDTGFGCFMDHAAFRLLQTRHAAQEEDDEGWLYARVHARLDQVDHTSQAVDERSGANAILFASGWGDGGYCSYWGFADEDHPVALLTDFRVL